ncbi:MAG: GH23 [uncultured Rubrobacteraceae bacterium]|uniref:GH23 n=1 Tax=uncultured Rubrobacteraceae bacterium TaxID=349277 RepID=A0A6J4R6I6_9ACTN|nr:MAG: GH23 [uncultured Rubrobacteraceae bacterium]
MLALLLAVLAVLPLLFMAPETVRRFIYPLNYEEIILEASEEYGVEPTLVAAVIREESRFDPKVESEQGAYGLMQIQPETARFISERSGIAGDYRGPNANIRMGTWYLNYLQNRYEDDERLVLAAYNSGEGRVDAWLSDESFDVASDIPFEETRDYVEDVIESEKNYEELYGRDLDRRQG